MAVDVGQTVRVLEMAGTFGDGTVIDCAQGRMVFVLSTQENGQATLGVFIPEAIDVQGHSETSRAGVAIVRSDGAFTMTVDPAAKRITGAVAVGTVDETMPLRDFGEVLFQSAL